MKVILFSGELIHLCGQFESTGSVELYQVRLRGKNESK